MTHYWAVLDFVKGRYWNLIQTISCFQILHTGRIHGKNFCSTWSLSVFSGKNKAARKVHSSQICSRANSSTRICLQDLQLHSKFSKDSAFGKYVFFPSIFPTKSFSFLPGVDLVIPGCSKNSTNQSSSTLVSPFLGWPFLLWKYGNLIFKIFVAGSCTTSFLLLCGDLSEVHEAFFRIVNCEESWKRMRNNSSRFQGRF